MTRTETGLPEKFFYVLMIFLPWGFRIQFFPGSDVRVWAVDLILAVSTVAFGISQALRGGAALIPPVGIQALLISAVVILVLKDAAYWPDIIRMVIHVYGSWFLASLAQAVRLPHKGTLSILILNLTISLVAGCYQSRFSADGNALVRGILPDHGIFSAYVLLGFLYLFPILLVQRTWFYPMLAIVLGLSMYWCLKSAISTITLLFGLLSQIVAISYFQRDWKNSRTVLSSLGAMAVAAIIAHMITSGPGVNVFPMNMQGPNPAGPGVSEALTISGPNSTWGASPISGTAGIFLGIGMAVFILGQIFNVTRDFRRSTSRRAMLIGALGSCIVFVCQAWQMDIFAAPIIVLFTIISSFGLQGGRAGTGPRTMIPGIPCPPTAGAGVLIFPMPEDGEPELSTKKGRENAEY